MAFQDDFSASLSRSGVTLDPASAPTRDTLVAGLTKLSAFISSLDSTTALALEEVTADFPVMGLLADPAVDVAPELASVFRAFDQANAHFSISDLAGICSVPLGFTGPPPTPGAPTIDSIEAHQTTLHDESHIIVHWSTRDEVDQYHFMWTDIRPPPTSERGWDAVELDAPGSRGHRFRISGMSQGSIYTFKVQGCKEFGFFFTYHKCSNFSADVEFLTPRNTHSLRQFLLLSNVSPNVSIRSLGAPAFSAGIRAMMHL
jgi:hypothetical protein